MLLDPKTNHNYAYPSYLLDNTTKLVDLVVRIERSKCNLRYDPGSYQTLIENLHCLKIESFTIENSEVFDRALGERENYMRQTSDTPWVDAIAPIQTLAHFQQLRQFTAPQEAFFSIARLDEDFNPCRLPLSIEHVTIHHATLATSR